MSVTNQHSSTMGDVGVRSVTLQSLPVELLAEIFSELDLDSLIMVSCLTRGLRAVIADASLNPWRRPILRNLHRRVYEKSLFHLSVRSIVPRQNWIEILTFASSSFLLFDSTSDLRNRKVVMTSPDQFSGKNFFEGPFFAFYINF